MKNEEFKEQNSGFKIQN